MIYKKIFLFRAFFSLVFLVLIFFFGFSGFFNPVFSVFYFPAEQGMWVFHHMETQDRFNNRTHGTAGDTAVTKVPKDPAYPYNETSNPMVDRVWTIKDKSAEMTCSERGESYKCTWSLPNTILSDEACSINLQETSNPSLIPAPTPLTGFSARYYHSTIYYNQDSRPLTRSYSETADSGLFYPQHITWDQGYYYPADMSSIKGPLYYVSRTAWSSSYGSKAYQLPLLVVDIRFSGVGFPSFKAYRAVYVWANKVDLTSFSEFKISCLGASAPSEAAWDGKTQLYAPAHAILKLNTSASALELEGRFAGIDGALMRDGGFTVSGISTETVHITKKIIPDSFYRTFLTTGNRTGTLSRAVYDFKLYPVNHSKIKIEITAEGYESIETELDYSDYYYTHYYGLINGLITDENKKGIQGANVKLTPFFEGYWRTPGYIASNESGYFSGSAKSSVFDSNYNPDNINLQIGIKKIYDSSIGYSNTYLPGKSMKQDFVLKSLVQKGEIKLVRAQMLPHGKVNRKFLDRISHVVQFDIQVDWSNNTPGSVVFETSSGKKISAPASGSRVTLSMDVGRDIGPAGKIWVQAIDSSGEVKSLKRSLTTRVMPAVPFQDIMGLAINTDVSGSFEYVSKFSKAVSFIKANMPGTECPSWVPFFGGKDLSLDFLPDLDLKVTSAGRAEYSLGLAGLSTQTDSSGNPLPDTGNDDLKTNMAGIEFSLKPYFKVFGDYSDSAGKWIWGGNAKVMGSAEAKKVFPFVVGSIPCFAGASLTLTASSSFGLKEFLPDQQVFNKSGVLVLRSEVEGKVGAGVESIVAAEGFIKGRSNVVFSWPEDKNTSSFVNPDYNLQSRDFSVTVGGRAYVLVWKWDRDFKTWKWPGAAPAEKVLINSLGQSSVSALSMPGFSDPVPMDRTYLYKPDYEKFNPLAGGGSAMAAGSSVAAGPSVTASTVTASSVTGLSVTALSGASVSCLASGVFPFADPEFASSSPAKYIAWLYDDPARTSLNRTVVRVSINNSGLWSSPKAVNDDTTGDFRPNMKAFDDGVMHICWENLKGTYTEGVDTLDDMLAGMEISVAKTAGATLEFTGIQTLTSDAFMDRNPMISGPSSDDLILTWIKNESNHLTGLSDKPNKIYYSLFNGVFWSAPALAAEVPYRLLSYSVVYRGKSASDPSAVIVMCCGTADQPAAADIESLTDQTDTFSAVRDRELFTINFNNTSWTGLTRLTQDSEPDDNPQLALGAAGNVMMLWLKSGKLRAVNADTALYSPALPLFNMDSSGLVFDTEYNSNMAEARLISDSSLSGSSGTIALLWPATTGDHTDLNVIFYNSAQNIWGYSKTLTSDNEIERSLSADFTSSSTIGAVYHRNLYVDGETLLPDDPGGDVTVPVLENSDIYYLSYGLKKDLMIVPQSLSLNPPVPALGSSTEIKAIIKNQGDFPAQNFDISFGHCAGPDEEGKYRDYIESGRITYSSAAAPGQTIEVTGQWAVPADFSNRVFQISVDPDSAYETVVDLRDNNTLQLNALGPDIALLPPVYEEKFPGLYEIFITLKNIGNLPCRNFTIDINNAASGLRIKSVSMNALLPGQTGEVQFDYNVNALLESESRFSFEVKADPLNQISELDESNNSHTFSIDGALGRLSLASEKVNFNIVTAYNENDTVTASENMTRQIILTNSGSADLVLNRIHLQGSESFAFFTEPESSFQEILPPGASKYINIIFKPFKAGMYNASLVIESNDTIRPVVILPVTAGAVHSAQNQAGLSIAKMELVPGEINIETNAQKDISDIEAVIEFSDGVILNAGFADLGGLSSVRLANGSGSLNQTIFSAPSYEGKNYIIFTLTAPWANAWSSQSAQVTVNVKNPFDSSQYRTFSYMAAAKTDDDGSVNIYRYNLDKYELDNTADPVKLTDNTFINRSPDISYDSSKIIFTSNSGGNFDIYVMNRDGTGIKALTSTPENEYWPRFNSIGTQICYVSDKGGNKNIHVMNVDQFTMDVLASAALTSHESRDDQPCFSSDASRVYFVSDREGNSEMFSVNVQAAFSIDPPGPVDNAAAGLVRLTYTPDLNEAMPTALMDENIKGDIIYYSMGDENSFSGLYISDSYFYDSHVIKPAKTENRLFAFSRYSKRFIHESSYTDDGYNYQYYLYMALPDGTSCKFASSYKFLENDRPALYIMPETVTNHIPVKLTDVTPLTGSQASGIYPYFELAFSGPVNQSSVEKMCFLRRARLLNKGYPVKVLWHWNSSSTWGRITSLEPFETSETAGLDIIYGACDANDNPIYGFKRNIALPIRKKSVKDRLYFSYPDPADPFNYKISSMLPGSADADTGVALYEPAEQSDFGGLKNIMSLDYLEKKSRFLLTSSFTGNSAVYLAESDMSFMQPLSDPQKVSFLTDIDSEQKFALLTVAGSRDFSQYIKARDLFIAFIDRDDLNKVYFKGTEPEHILKIVSFQGTCVYAGFVKGLERILITEELSDNSRNIFTTDYSGANRVDLFTGIVTRGIPQITEDNSSVLISVGPSSDNHIWKCSLDGLVKEQITGVSANHIIYKDFDSAADSDRIIFIRNSNGINSLVIVDEVSKTESVLVSTENYISNPQISPDKSMIAYNINVGYISKVFAVSVSGNESTGLTNPDFSSSVYSFTPDSKNILFLSSRPYLTASLAFNGLFSVPLSGGTETRLTGYAPISFFDFEKYVLPNQVTLNESKEPVLPSDTVGLVITPGSVSLDPQVSARGYSLDETGLVLIDSFKNTFDLKSIWEMVPSDTALWKDLVNRVDWSLVSGGGAVIDSKFYPPYTGGTSVLRASVMVPCSSAPASDPAAEIKIFSADLKVQTKIKPLKIMLAREDIYIYTGRTFNFQELAPAVLFTDGSSRVIEEGFTQAAYTLISGSGTLASDFYTTASVPEKAVLRVSVIIEGITIYKDFTITSHSGIESVSLVPSFIDIPSDSAFDLQNIQVTGKTADTSFIVTTPVWTIISGSGTITSGAVNNTGETNSTGSSVFNSPSITETQILRASYNWNGTVLTADLRINTISPVKPRIQNLRILQSGVSLEGIRALTFETVFSDPQIFWESCDPDTVSVTHLFWSDQNIDPALLEPLMNKTDTSVMTQYNLNRINNIPITDFSKSSVFTEKSFTWKIEELLKIPDIENTPLYVYAVIADNSESGYSAAAGQAAKYSNAVYIKRKDQSDTVPQAMFTQLSQSSLTALDTAPLDIKLLVADNADKAVQISLYYSPGLNDITRAVHCLDLNKAVLTASVLPYLGTSDQAYQAYQADPAAFQASGRGFCSFKWNTLDADAGKMYVLALVSDGVNDIQKIWSPNEVDIVHDNSASQDNTAPGIIWKSPSAQDPVRGESHNALAKLNIFDNDNDALVVDIFANRVTAETESMFRVAAGITIENTSIAADYTFPLDLSQSLSGAYYLMASVRPAALPAAGDAESISSRPVKVWSSHPVFVDKSTYISDICISPFYADTVNSGKVCTDISFRTSISASSEFFYGTSMLTGLSVQGEEALNHIIKLSGLEPVKKYFFKIKIKGTDNSGLIIANTADNNGRYYSFITPGAADTAIPARDAWIKSKTIAQDYSALAGAIIKVYLIRPAAAESSSSEIVSLPLAAVSDSQGQWSINLSRAGYIDANREFKALLPLDSDKLSIEVRAGGDLYRFIDNISLAGIEQALSIDSALDPVKAVLPLGIVLSQESVEHIVTLQKGFNLAAATVQADPALTARTVMDLAGKNCIAVYYYSSETGSYQNMLRLDSGLFLGEDFDLDITQGFFVKMAEQGSITFKGRKIDRPMGQSVLKGFNMITIPFGRYFPADLKTELTALDLLKRLGPDGIAVYSFESGSYKSVLRIGSGNEDKDFLYTEDFPIIQGKGYFIKSRESAAFDTDMQR